MTRRVLYIRDDGKLAAEVEKRAQEMRDKTHANISNAEYVRRLLWAAFDSPKALRQARLA